LRRVSSEERAALANKLADAAMRHQRRATELAEIAQKVRPHGWNLGLSQIRPHRMSTLRRALGSPLAASPALAAHLAPTSANPPSGL
jgi:hypothetical protein